MFPGAISSVKRISLAVGRTNRSKRAGSTVTMRSEHRSNAVVHRRGRRVDVVIVAPGSSRCASRIGSHGVRHCDAAYRLGLTCVRTFWFGSAVRRSRMLIAVLAILSLVGGGLLARVSTGGSGGSNALAASGVGRVGDGSVLVAAQPAPTAVPAASTPSASSTARPSATSPSTTTSAKPTPSPKPKPIKTTPPAGTAVVDQLLAQINDLRAQHGLPPYSLLSGLNRSAHKHNLVMEGSCGMSHQCPGEASLGDRISAQGVHWTSCGENIGWSGPHPNTTSAIVSAAEGLTTSMYNETPPDDGHRLNLLSSSFHHIGIDVVRDSSGKVWLTQDFSS